jgi:hypothetical protein
MVVARLSANGLAEFQAGSAEEIERRRRRMPASHIDRFGDRERGRSIGIASRHRVAQ